MLNKLIGMLEGLSAPDRGKDFAIAWVLCWPQIEGAPDLTPEFTRSMDAAASLVPSGYDWCVQSPGRYAQVWKGGAPHYEGNGANPALGICIAALKARQALIEPQPSDRTIEQSSIVGTQENG